MNWKMNELKGYFNTTNLTGVPLTKEQHNAANQEDIITDIFKSLNGRECSPGGIHCLTMSRGYKWPLTSIRRAITVLTDKEVLVKTDNQVTGLFGKKEYCWKLKVKEGQIQMF